MRRQASNRGWVIMAAVTLIGLAPLLILGQVVSGRLVSWPSLIHYAAVVYAGVRLAGLFGRARPEWFATMFWAFCYVWLGLAAWAQWLTGRNPFSVEIPADLHLRTGVVVLVGMVAWDVGYRLARRTARPAPSEVEGRRRFVVTPARVLAVSIFAYLTVPFLLMRQGGWTALLRTRSEVGQAFIANGLASETSQVAGSLVVAFTRVPPLVALIGFVLVMQRYPALRLRPAWWAVGAATVALNVLANNPIGNSRVWSVTVILGAILLLRPMQRPGAYGLLLAGLLLALTVAFPYADHFRYPDQEFQSRGVDSFMTGKLDYDASAQIANGIRMRDALGPTDGRQILGGLAFAVPRSYWGGKPNHTGEEIAVFMGFETTNISAPLWVEGYIDFGLFGTAGLLALVGGLSGFADRRYLADLRGLTPGLAVALLPPLAAYSVVLLRGSIQGTLGQGLALAVLSLLLVTRSGATPRLGALPGSNAARRLREHRAAGADY